MCSRRTAETSPLALMTVSTWPFLGLVFVGLILGLRGGWNLVIAHSLLLLITAALSLWVMRNIPLFCIAAVPVLALWTRDDPSPDSSFRRLQARVSAIDSALKGHLWSVLALPACAAILAWHGISTRRGLYEYEAQRFPVAAVDWMVAHDMQGSAFNDINWGGYLLYRMWPRTRVFIDSQSDFYGEQFIREYDGAYQASGDWRGVLDRYGVSSALLPPAAPLAINLKGDPQWTIAYQDSSAVVLVR